MKDEGDNGENISENGTDSGGNEAGTPTLIELELKKAFLLHYRNEGHDMDFKDDTVFLKSGRQLFPYIEKYVSQKELFDFKQTLHDFEADYNCRFGIDSLTGKKRKGNVKARTVREDLFREVNDIKGRRRNSQEPARNFTNGFIRKLRCHYNVIIASSRIFNALTAIEKETGILIEFPADAAVAYVNGLHRLIYTIDNLVDETASITGIDLWALIDIFKNGNDEKYKYHDPNSKVPRELIEKLRRAEKNMGKPF